MYSLIKIGFPQGCLKNRELTYPNIIDKLRKFSSKIAYFPARGFCTAVRLNSYFTFFFSFK